LQAVVPLDLSLRIIFGYQYHVGQDPGDGLSNSEVEVIKLVVHLVVFAIGAGVGVWWGVNHPQQAQNIAAVEQAKMNQYIAMGKQQALQDVQQAQAAAPANAPASPNVMDIVQKKLQQANDDFNTAKKQISGQ
jgi:flagellar basal body-associated protein FliL